MFFSAFERLIALRYLRARKQEGFVSVISAFSIAGIALGVATLIVVTSVMNGVREEMLSRFIGIDGHVQLYGIGKGLSDYDRLAVEIRTQPLLAGVSPKVEGQAMVSSRGQAQGAQVVGFRYDDLMKKPLFKDNITQGDMAAFERGEGVVIGERMAQNMGLKIGDMLTLISPEGRSTFAGMVPRMKAYPVVATFKLGMNAYDSGLVLLPFEEAQLYFKLKGEGIDAVSGLEITAKNIEQAPQLARDLKQALGGSYRVYDWQQSNASVFSALTVQRNVMFLILTMIILVAAFNIISGLVMLVKDKGRAIAILRTMGAPRASISRIFFACGATIGLLGTGAGVTLGLLLAANAEAIRLWIEKVTGTPLLGEQLYYLSNLPTKTDPMEVLAIIAMSLGLSFLATLYPARKAAALDPAEALRYE